MGSPAYVNAWVNAVSVLSLYMSCSFDTLMPLAITAGTPLAVNHFWTRARFALDTFNAPRDPNNSSSWAVVLDGVLAIVLITFHSGCIH